MERREPGAAHRALMLDLNTVIDRYANMPAIERVAVVAQFLGHRLAELPDGQYSVAEVMHTVSRNIEQGNRQDGALAVAGQVGHG
jgi:hypothetical protein